MKWHMRGSQTDVKRVREWIRMKQKIVAKFHNIYQKTFAVFPASLFSLSLTLFLLHTSQQHSHFCLCNCLLCIYVATNWWKKVCVGISFPFSCEQLRRAKHLFCLLCHIIIISYQTFASLNGWTLFKNVNVL